MGNERKTEDIVRSHIKNSTIFNSIILEEQKSDNPRIQKLLQNASKSGNGVGKPEFLIHGFQYPINNLLIVIECKASISKHNSIEGNRYSEYAVDGVKLYASYLAKEFDVLAIAVSGENKDNIRVSHFYYKNGGKEEHINVEDNKLHTLENYIEIINIKNQKEFSLEKLREFAKELNDDLHNHSIPEDKRAFLLSGILLSLSRDSGFRTSYKNYDDPNSLAELLVNSIGTILKKENIPTTKIETLTSEYNFINTHHSLIEENKEIKEMYLKKIIEEIEENVAKPLENSKNQKYIDAIGEMYTEFLKYANNEAKLGIVLTPPHVTEFMCELININKDDTVIDICCGTAGFLIAAMTIMIKECKNDFEKIDYIKRNQIIGVEEKSNIHALGCANMILHGDGKSHIIQLDCFSADKDTYFFNKKITKALLNPPYKAGESPAKQLEFIEKSLELLEPNGKCAAIVQMSCAIKNDNKVKEMKRKILSKHTLEAVISMPDDLFYPVGVVTCIMIFTAHTKHKENYNTWFGYLKDDGFEKRKYKGRIDFKNKWKDIKNNFLTLFTNKQEKAGNSIQKYVQYTDEWCAEAYMETDYTKLTEKDFENTIKKYISFLVMEN